VIGEWGIRKWMQSDAKKTKRTNVHIARQSLILDIGAEMIEYSGVPINRF
jgi:hypothetical protein